MLKKWLWTLLLMLLLLLTLETYHLDEVEMSDYMNQEENKTGHIQGWFLGTIILQVWPWAGSGWLPGLGLQTVTFWAISTLT